MGKPLLGLCNSCSITVHSYFFSLLDDVFSLSFYFRFDRHMAGVVAKIPRLLVIVTGRFMNSSLPFAVVCMIHWDLDRNPAIY